MLKLIKMKQAEKDSSFLCLLLFYLKLYGLIRMKAATPAGTVRTEDPGLSNAKEAAEAVPAESVRRNGD